jgi:bis(5'-nucleosyl)-tetraphosphatase (symmetrical)
MATYLVGDIQGCYDGFAELLEKIRFDPAEDFLWPCGDLVNRGGQSLEVLRLLYSLAPRVNVTLGNHDLHLLAMQARFPRGGTQHSEFEKVLLAPDCGQLVDWLASQPLAVFSEQHQLLRVHAGVIPQWDVATTLRRAGEIHSLLQGPQRRKFLRKMYGSRPRLWRDELMGWKRKRLISRILTQLRFCRADGRADFATSGPPDSGKGAYKPWFQHKHRKTRDVRVAFGHWAAMGLKVKKRYLALDSGYVWGGQLSAYRLEDGEIIQVSNRAKAVATR